MLPKWIVFVLMALILTACSGKKTIAPVEDSSRLPAQYEGVHIVSKGETLFAIAWRYGRDFHELAANNHVAAPYTIYPGQKIELAQQGTIGSAPVSHAIATQDNSEPKWITVNESTPTQSHTPVEQQPAQQPTTQAITTVAQTPLAVAGKGTWLWPSTGKVERGFSSQNNGLDIVAPEGSPIIATAAGNVVYSGSGLRGYGELIIIKHDERYLSAYAHNRVLLVKEGDKVQAGQKIAEMGRSGTDSVMLHFEVRQEGKPVDPLLFLAKK